MEPTAADDEERTLTQQGSSTGSASSTGTPYYSHKNGEWRSERRMLDITRDKPVKVCVRVVVPVRDHPKFNFVGKLLGPKGNSLKRLQEETMCKMAVLGRGSMKDRQKEEELRVSGDPKFAHLADELHVEISAFATPAEAHARIAYALAELRRFLVPDYNDDIRQQQMLEMQLLSAPGRRSPDAPAEDALARLSSMQSGAAPLAGVLQAQLHRDFSPPAPAPAAATAPAAPAAPAPPEHLAHHQLGHGVLLGGGVMPHHQQHHLIQNSILGGGDILGLSGPMMGGVLHHPALRGVKPTAALATQGAAGAAGGRKRPLLGGARAVLSPTKRAVLSLLARARAAAHQPAHQPWPGPHEHAALLPLIRDEFLSGVGVNINLA